MFDLGFSELLLFGVIALIVLGPEKLPHAARTAGRWYAKMRRAVSTLQNEIEAELDLAETRQKMQEELAKIKQAEAEMKREMAELRGSMKEFEATQNENLKTSSVKPSVINLDKSKSNSTNNYDNTANEEVVNTKVVNLDIDNKVVNTDIEMKSTSVNVLENTLTQSEHEQILEQMTRPWRHMWFLLSDFDKVRRLPPPPFTPRYKADALLNTSPNSSSIDSIPLKKTSINIENKDLLQTDTIDKIEVIDIVSNKVRL